MLDSLRRVRLASVVSLAYVSAHIPPGDLNERSVDRTARGAADVLDVGVPREPEGAAAARPRDTSGRIWRDARIGAHGSPRRGTPVASEVDTTGVPIVRFTVTGGASVRFSLDTKVSFQVGGLEESEVEFDHRQGYLNAVRLSTGGYAVIDGHRVHYFDRSARRVRVAGRRGSGPEEFRNLVSLCRTRGDTLVVLDSWNGRFAILDGSGKVVRTFRQSGMRSFPADFCFPDGSMLLMETATTSVTGEQRVRLVRVDHAGAVLNTVGELQASPLDMVSQTVPQVGILDGRLYYADGRAGDITVYTASGTVLRILRSMDERVLVKPADIDRRLGSLEARSVRGQAVIARMRANAPRVWPAFDRMLVGPDGLLWLQDFRPRLDAPDRWTALDTAGRVIGRLDMSAPNPSAFREVLGFGRNEVLVRQFDSDGAVHVVVFPLERRELR